MTFFKIKILKQLECCLVYFSNSSQATVHNELHCHSYQLLLWKKVNEDATKPTDGCSVLTHPDSSMLGASSKWNTTGALQKGLWRTSSWHWCLTACGGTKQCFFINSNVTCTHFSIVSLVFSYGVWNRLGHTWSGELTLWNNKMKQWSMKKLCGAIKGSYTPANLISFIAWFMGHDVALKRPTLLHNFQHFFFPSWKAAAPSGVLKYFLSFA